VQSPWIKYCVALHSEKGAVSCQIIFFYNEYLFTADEHPGWQANN